MARAEFRRHVEPPKRWAKADMQAVAFIERLAINADSGSARR